MHHIITSIQHQCLSQNVPIISEPTVSFLQNILTKKTCAHYREIGTAQGYSTLIAAETLRTQHTHINTREISYPQYKKALTHFATYDYPHITAHYGDASTCDRKKHVTQPIDIIFLDAQKSKYQEILMSLRPHIADDGLIIIDDVIKFKSKTTSLYHRLDQNHIQYTIHHLDDDDGVMIIDKKT